MSFTVLQNTPTVIDLAGFAPTTGWTLGDGYADHEVCNAGNLYVKDTFVAPQTGVAYTIAYKVINYVSGTIRLSLGTANGVVRTANGNYVETITATGTDPLVKFYSDGYLRLEVIDVKSATPNVTTKKRNTIVYSEIYNKWTTYFSFTSDFGLSLFKDLFTFKAGKMYRHDPALTPRNNIYGVQYDTIIDIPFNANKGQSKTYESLSYESNILMVTTENGVKTSLGQVSGLTDQDFLRELLDDGVTQVEVYQDEGMYLASFTKEGSNQVDGSELKGTYITVELITAETGVLILKNVMVNSVPSYIGGR